MAERGKRNAKSPQAVSFEELMSSLEQIVERIETGEIGLEDSLREYERGVELIRRGRQILSQVEQRVERLRIDGDASSEAAAVDEEGMNQRSGGGAAAADEPADHSDEDLPI